MHIICLSLRKDFFMLSVREEQASVSVYHSMGGID